MIVPWFPPQLLELILHSLIFGTVQAREVQIGGAFNNGLTLAVQGKVAIMALVRSELSGGGHNDHVLAVADEDGAFAGCNEDEAVFGVIDVEVGGYVENEKITIFALIDVILLLFDGIYLFDFERALLVHELVVVRVVFLLDGLFGFEDVWVLHLLLLHLHFRRLLLNLVLVFDELLFRVYLDLHFIRHLVLVLDELFLRFGLLLLHDFAGEHFEGFGGDDFLFFVLVVVLIVFFEVADVFVHFKGVLVDVVGLLFFLPFGAQPFAHPHLLKI